MGIAPRPRHPELVSGLILRPETAGVIVRIAIVLLFTTVLTACTSQGYNVSETTKLERNASIYPPEVAPEVWLDMAVFEEGPLSSLTIHEEFDSRYRLSVAGVRCDQYVIRLDRRPDGTAVGLVKKYDQCGISEVRRLSATRFVSSRADVTRFEEALEKASMFETYPEIWEQEFRPDRICLDGVELVFERMDSSGYRASVGNAFCSAPPGMIEAARVLIEIAEADSAMDLVR